MSGRLGYNLDEASRIAASGLMAQCHCTGIGFGDECGDWDVSAVNAHGHTVAVEVKDRRFPHDRYPTMMCGVQKGNSLAAFDRVLLLCFYSDGVAMVGDIRGAKVERKVVPYKTEVQYYGHDGEWVEKDHLMVEPTYKLLKLNGKWRIV